MDNELPVKGDLNKLFGGFKPIKYDWHPQPVQPPPQDATEGTPQDELAKKHRGFIYGRFVNLDSPDQLIQSLAIRNRWQQSDLDDNLRPPPGMFFDCSPARSPEELAQEVEIYRINSPDAQLDFVEMGNGVGCNVYFDKKTAKVYLEHSPFVAHILIHIDPDSYPQFAGLLNLSTNIDYRKREYTPVDSFTQLRESVVTIELGALRPSQLAALGDQVNVAIYNAHNLNPQYTSYASFLGKNRS